MKTISYDVWGTLLKSNPDFKMHQSDLAHQFSGINPEDFLVMKDVIKKEFDTIVEQTGIQPDRVEAYRRIFPDLSIKEINSFIYYSDKLFLAYPPELIPDSRQLMWDYLQEGFTPVISSNTVFIHGDVLGKIIWEEFHIPMCQCNFSDILGVSKPNEKMFNFKIKPTMHVGDNPITDGACEKFGIKFINIKDANI